MNNGDVHILVVDDDADVRTALVDVLAEEGYMVATAVNGMEALNLLLARTVIPQVILLDVLMPIMDGFEFLAACCHHKSLLSIPIVVLSADWRIDYNRPDGVSSVRQYLRKPVQLPELLETVSSYCAQPTSLPH